MVTGTLTKLLEETRQACEPKRNYIGSSEIGNPCWRNIWFNYHGEHKKPRDARTNRILSIGKYLENYVLQLISGIISVQVPIKDAKDKELPYFFGHPDAIIRLENKLYVLEIKTANHASFQQLVKHGLRKWNEQYYAQVQCYLGFLNMDSGFLLCLNKNTGQFHDEYVEFDHPYFEQLRIKAKAIHDATIPPPKINKSPLFWTCRMCAFKDKCHSDDNHQEYKP